MPAPTVESRRDKLLEVAQTIGTVEGTATSRLKDGTEVAWAVHVSEHADKAAASDADVVTVVGANLDKLLLLRVAAGPLVAMQIVRSLCHRGGELAAGAITWLEPGDVARVPYFSRPSAYLVLSPRELGIEHAPVELLVAAGLAWSEVLLPIDELRAAVIARHGVAASTAGQLTGSDLQTAATNMIALLKRSTDIQAINVAAYGLSELVGRGAGAALIRPLVDVLRDRDATVQARESAAHLLDEAGAIEPVLEAVLAVESRHIVLTVFQLRVIESVTDIAIDAPLADAGRLGLPDGFQLNSDERIADVEAAVQRQPLAWAEWLINQLPPRDPRAGDVQQFLAASREQVRSKLQARAAPS